MKRIAILVRTGVPYDDVFKNSVHRPWLEQLKKNPVSPDISIYKYIKYKYPQVIVHKYSPNTIHKLDPSKYDYVFTLFVDLVMLFLSMVRNKGDKVKYDAYVNKLQNIPNLVPSFRYMQFVTDKCKYYKWLSMNDFPVLETKCVKLRPDSTYISKRLMRLRNLGNGDVFMKPIPSAETKNAKRMYHNTNKNEVTNYVDYLKRIKYDQIIVQPFIKDFGTRDNRELRTYWLGTNYMYTVETEGSGWPQYIRRKPIPDYVKKQSIVLLEKLSNKFGENLVLTRIDWGKTNGEYFINEIEYAPGVFSYLFSPSRWKLDAKIGDFIVKY